MKRILLTITLLTLPIAFAQSVAAKDIEFQLAGKKVKSLSQKGIYKLTPETKVTVNEPQEKRDIVFKGADLRALLDKVYGPTWVKARFVTAICTDGYKPQIKVAALLKGTPFLAFGIEGQKKFEITKDGKAIDAGPTYLIWTDKMDAAQQLAHVSAGNWPYQVEKFNVVE